LYGLFHVCEIITDPALHGLQVAQPGTGSPCTVCPSRSPVSRNADSRVIQSALFIQKVHYYLIKENA